MILRKKGQTDGGSVAVIIIVIALFMVLYILFVPPDVRHDLLNLQNDSSVSTSTGRERQELIAESPGVVSPTKSSIFVHKLSSMNLFLKTEPKVTKLASNLIVKNGLFAKSSPIVRFSMASLDDTAKATLFFSISEASGELRVKVNGNTIYSEDITSPGIKVIEIARSYLKKDNEVEFAVSKGIFSSHVYTLQDVGVKQEFQLKNSEEKRTLSVSSEEKKNMESATLTYKQFCKTRLDSGLTTLEIRVNDRTAFSKQISCLSVDESVDLKESLFSEGANSLTFVLGEGDFLFSDVELRTKTKESSFPSYTFTLTSENFQKVKDGSRKITLNVLLEDNKARKNANFQINSNEVLMRTDSREFNLNLKDYVIDGTNFLRVVPSNTFTILGLKVTLE